MTDNSKKAFDALEKLANIAFVNTSNDKHSVEENVGLKLTIERALTLAQEAEQLRKERDELELAVQALEQKLKCEAQCACSYDKPTDICMKHLPIVTELQSKLDESNAACKSYHTALGQRDKRIAELEAKLDKAKDGLRFYLQDNSETLDDGINTKLWIPAMEDRGQSARTILEEIE